MFDHRDLVASSLPRAYAGTGEASPEGEPLVGNVQSDVAVVGPEDSGFPGRGPRLRSWPPGSGLVVAAASQLIRRIDERHAWRAGSPIRSNIISTGH